MKYLAGGVGWVLVFFAISLLFLDLSELSTNYRLSLKILTFFCLSGGFGIPILWAWLSKRAGKPLRWYKGLAWGIVGTMMGGIVGEVLMGFNSVETFSRAVAEGAGFGIALGFIIAPAVALITYSTQAHNPSSTSSGREEGFWVFCYGSLMTDGWESEFHSLRSDKAILNGFHRSFNKQSTRNWGSSNDPCPTLGLEKDEEGQCVGMAFRFPASRRAEVEEYLRSREGPSFELKQRPIFLADGTSVQAIVAVNRRDASSYIGDRSLRERAEMVSNSEGRDGSCQTYFRNVQATLADIGVEDPYVDEFADAVDLPYRSQHNAELEVTWPRAIKVWWSIAWRQTVYGAVAGALVGTPVAFMWGQLSRAQVPPTSVAFWFGTLAAIPVGIWIVRRVLKKSWGNFRITLVSTSGG